MADTLTQQTSPPAQTSAPASNPGNISAVSQALAQAIPPGRQNTVQSPKESSLETQTSRSNQPAKSSSNVDRVLTEEDFEENPFTPKPPSAKKVEKTKEETVKQKVDKTQDNQEQDNSEKTPEQEVEDLNKESDNKLELDINLDENKLPETKEDKTPKGKRDYSKFKPEHKKYLEKLPNHLFNEAAQEFENIYKIEQENQQLKEKFKNTEAGKLPENYYEHPEAYQLSPTYSQLNQELYLDGFEENHWEAQLANIKRGQPWYRLDGYRSDTKEPVYTKVEPIKDSEGNVVLDINAEREAEKNIAKVNRLKEIHSDKLSQLKVLHKQDYEKSKEGLTGLKKQFFSAFLDESKLPPAVKADLQLAKDTIGQQLPAFRSNPAMELLIYSYAALKAQNRQIIKMAQLLNNSATKAELDRQAGPGKTEFRGGTTQGDKILSASDFED